MEIDKLASETDVETETKTIEKIFTSTGVRVIHKARLQHIHLDWGYDAGRKIIKHILHTLTNAWEVGVVVVGASEVVVAVAEEAAVVAVDGGRCGEYCRLALCVTRCRSYTCAPVCSLVDRRSRCSSYDSCLDTAWSATVGGHERAACLGKEGQGYPGREKP